MQLLEMPLEAILTASFTIIYIERSFDTVRLQNAFIIELRLLSKCIWPEIKLYLYLNTKIKFKYNLILTAGENDRVENRAPADDWPKISPNDNNKILSHYIVSHFILSIVSPTV